MASGHLVLKLLNGYKFANQRIVAKLATDINKRWRGTMDIFRMSFGFEFWAYIGWQFYLETLMWHLPEDDPPPDGGIPSEVASATSVLS